MSILIVDDKLEIRVALTKVLRKSGYGKLLTAESAEDAFEQLGLDDPAVSVSGVDLILMDIEMPGINGIEACRRIKSRPRLRDIPVIMITACADTKALELAFSAGASDYLLKTSSRVEMLARVSTALESKRSLDTRKLAYLNEVEAKNRELERAFEQLAEKNRQLEEASLDKNQVLCTVTHELKTPLTSVLGYVERVVSRQQEVGPLNERQEKYLRTALRNARRLKLLVDDILDVSLMEGWKLEVNTINLEVGQEIRDVVNSLQTQFKAKGIGVTLDIPPDLVPVQADRLRFSQIIGNLLSNASKYSPEGSRIRVSARVAAGMLQIDVADNGIGVAPEHQSQIFTKFFRVDHSSTRQTDGTGLGLFITKQLIEVHGGRIWVESAVDQGSTFSFTLPLGPNLSGGQSLEQRDQLFSEEDRLVAA
ncbi:MAG: ATP-binding protein [Dehalococcoidia bacterium]